MCKGGFCFIDFKDTNLTVDGDAVKIPGVYAALESNHRKATIITNMTMDGVEKPDRFVNFGHYDNTYTGSIGLNTVGMFLYVTIDEDDMVTLSEQ